ncbi:MAG: glycosyl transferase, partial [Aeromicrobium sp.]|nr:glycosyl transferase [Aeromicrobium sp.]
MKSAPEKIAIAIVTFNRSTYLKELLASAAAMDTPPFAIVVVDNASTDDTQEVIVAATGDFPDGMLINHKLDTNTGGSGGFSEGTKVALELGADWVWLMDDDVEILPDAMAQFAPWMQRFQVIHGRRYDFDGTPF